MIKSWEKVNSKEMFSCWHSNQLDKLSMQLVANLQIAIHFVTWFNERVRVEKTSMTITED